MTVASFCPTESPHVQPVSEVFVRRKQHDQSAEEIDHSSDEGAHRGCPPPFAENSTERDLDQRRTILAKATDTFTPLTVHRSERDILNTVRRLQQLTRTRSE